MVDEEKNDENNLNWPDKARDRDNMAEDDEKRTILDEDENEIEVELKDISEEQEEESKGTDDENKQDNGQEGTIYQTPEDRMSDETAEHKNLGTGVSENRIQPEISNEEAVIFSNPEHRTAREAVSVSKDVLPNNMYAHFLLIDIDAPVKEIRGLPRYLAINCRRILIGRYSRAHILLDDPSTVEARHAKVVLEEIEGKRDFVIYQINDSTVSVNGVLLSRDGIALKCGDRVEIGSARLIFFCSDPEMAK